MPSPGRDDLLDPAPEREGPAWHGNARRNATGKQIAERHEGFDCHEVKIGEAAAKGLEVALKHDPRKGAVRSGQWSRGRKAPRRCIRSKGLGMKRAVDDAGPAAEPRLHHYDASAPPQRALCLRQESL